MPRIDGKDALIVGGLAIGVLILGRPGMLRRQPCCSDCAARAAGGYVSPDGSGPAGGNEGLQVQSYDRPSGYGGNFTGGRHH